MVTNDTAQPITKDQIEQALPALKSPDACAVFAARCAMRALPYCFGLDGKGRASVAAGTLQPLYGETPSPYEYIRIDAIKEIIWVMKSNPPQSIAGLSWQQAADLIDLVLLPASPKKVRKAEAGSKTA